MRCSSSTSCPMFVSFISLMLRFILLKLLTLGGDWFETGWERDEFDC